MTMVLSAALAGGVVFMHISRTWLTSLTITTFHLNHLLLPLSDEVYTCTSNVIVNSWNVLSAIGSTYTWSSHVPFTKGISSKLRAQNCSCWHQTSRRFRSVFCHWCSHLHRYSQSLHSDRNRRGHNQRGMDVCFAYQARECKAESTCTRCRTSFLLLRWSFDGSFSWLVHDTLQLLSCQFFPIANEHQHCCSSTYGNRCSQWHNWLKIRFRCRGLDHVTGTPRRRISRVQLFDCSLSL